jgi:hypothetical protein
MRILAASVSLVPMLACTPTRLDPGVQAAGVWREQDATVADTAPPLPTFVSHPLVLSNACGWTGAWQTTYALADLRAVAAGPDAGFTVLTSAALLHTDDQGRPGAMRALPNLDGDPVAMARLPGAWAIVDGQAAQVVLLGDQGSEQSVPIAPHAGDRLRAVTTVGTTGLAVGGLRAGDPIGAADSLARVLRVDEAATVLWDRTYAPGLAAESLVALPDGGLAVLGRSAPAALPQAWLTRLDPQGQPLWTWTQGAHASGQFLTARGDGSLLAVIDATVGYQGQCTSVLTAVSGQGQTLWSRCVGDDAAQLLVLPRGAAELAGGTALALLQGSGKGRGQVTLDASDSLGLPLWNATMTDWGTDTDVQGVGHEHGIEVHARALVALTDGGLLLGGEVEGHAWLARLPPGQGCPAR